jgi:hypothetical protein
MESSVLSLGSARTRSASAALAIPWQLTAVVFAATSVIVGLIWDISWHMSIGRDTFWTPAHLAIYIGGAVAGLASGYEVLRRSFFSATKPTDGVTIWRFFNGPLGGWLAIWGAVAMLTSAPFDDWWHNAYGLDVQIISPPHSVLALGFIAILTGAVVLGMSVQARESQSADASRAPWIVAYASGLVLTMVAIFTTEYHDRTMMHGGLMYAVASLVFPFALVSAARSVRLRYPATAVAGVYTLVMCLQAWILPLFAASPKLGPIRTAVTHMVPLDFPLLLIVPAIVFDVLLPRLTARSEWTRALVLGVTFVVVFTAVQWPFANFLMSDASRNAFFRTDNFSYQMPADWLLVLGRFEEEPLQRTLTGFAAAIVLAVLSTRIGLARGSWLRAVRR